MNQESLRKAFQCLDEAVARREDARQPQTGLPRGLEGHGISCHSLIVIDDDFYYFFHSVI